MNQSIGPAGPAGPPPWAVTAVCLVATTGTPTSTRSPIQPRSPLNRPPPTKGRRCMTERTWTVEIARPRDRSAVEVGRADGMVGSADACSRG